MVSLLSTLSRSLVSPLGKAVALLAEGKAEKEELETAITKKGSLARSRSSNLQIQKVRAKVDVWAFGRIAPLRRLENGLCRRNLSGT